MDEVLQIIAHQKQQIRERDDYIKALHMGIACFGLALLLVSLVLVYVIN